MEEEKKIDPANQDSILTLTGLQLKNLNEDVFINNY